MREVSNQADFKTEVKLWLKSHGLDYKWMAAQCGISEVTFRNWMSQKSIPPLKQILIERVMVQIPAAISSLPSSSSATVGGITVNAAVTLTISLTPEIYQRVEEKAAACGTTADQLVVRSIEQLVSDTTILPNIKQRVVTLPAHR